MSRMQDVPLPGMPVPPPVHRSSQVRPGVRAVRTRPTRLCERCCELIHVRGQAGAPYPRAARWRVVELDVEFRLCDTHKDERVLK